MSTHPASAGGSALRPEAIPRERAVGARSALRVMDARTGQLTDIPFPPGGLLRIGVHLPCAGGVVGLTDLRAALICDVLQRTAEVEGLQVVHVRAVPDLDTQQAEVLDRATAALGIHPSAAVVAPGEVVEALGGRADVSVIVDGAERRDAPGGTWVAVGPARDEAAGRGTGEDRPIAGGLASGLVSGLVDATAVRLALLVSAYREPVRIDPQSVDEAAQTLQQWRRHVADWARMPSRAIPDEFRRQAGAAFTGDLDTPAACALLRRVEERIDLADGARFETFVSVDRILGLELARDLGRP